jgi:hypothetical protein
VRSEVGDHQAITDWPSDVRSMLREAEFGTGGLFSSNDREQDEEVGAQIGQIGLPVARELPL